MSDLETFRRRKNAFFKHDPHSPLTPQQREAFSGLRYYPENPALRFEVAARPLRRREVVALQTSTGEVAEFIRWGRIHFEVEGQRVALTLYASTGGGGFFLPFMDVTNGVETYAGGRYVEVDPLPDGRLVVDFNLAYNPYCAYNPYWSCPLPPKENRLKVPIRAGEMLPAAEWVIAPPAEE